MSPQTRWKFLASLILAVVALGGAGSYFAFYRPSASQTVTITPYVTTVTATPSVVLPIASFRLFGKIFFDYNGNGRQDAGEPAVADVTVALDGANRTTTNSTGWYVADIDEGIHKLGVFPPKKFRYMCESDAEFRSVKESYEIFLTRDTRKDIGLMEGFLTSPTSANQSIIESYVDIDPTPRKRDWKGGVQTYDGHPGTDFLGGEGTPILAVCPGRVIAAANGWPSNPRWTSSSYYQNGNFIIMDCGNNIFVAYHHLDSIAVNETRFNSIGDYVKRGQIIGHMGNTGTQVIHLHLQIWNGTGFMSGKVDALDPFRDMYYGQHGYSPWSNAVSLWTKDNDPQFFA